MTIYCGVYPINDAPIKMQIESILGVAVDVDGWEILDETDLRVFKPRKQEFEEEEQGPLRCDGNLEPMRKQLPQVWNRMSNTAKIWFLNQQFNGGILYLYEIMQAMKDVGADVAPETIGEFQKSVTSNLIPLILEKVKD